MNKNASSAPSPRYLFCRYNHREFVTLVLVITGLSLVIQSCAWNASSARALPVSEASPRVVNARTGGAALTVTSIDTLSTSLATYLNSLGSNVGVVVEDVTHRHSYIYNSTQQFLTASSIKVPIMLTLFAQTENQGREPNNNEMDLLTTMVENSNNDAASALFSEIKGASGITAFLQQVGVSGLTPDDDAWGYSRITPQAMVDLLTSLHNGSILTAPDRATALQLMQQVESDQRWGAGDTAPGGSTVSMKNGWVPGPDNLWTVNSSGIIATNTETYILSVYTQEQQSFPAGQAVVQQVCKDIAAALS